jgi:hypothetical protein
MGRQNERVLEETGGGNSTVESHSSKVMVAGSNPVPRSKKFPRLALADAQAGLQHKTLACGKRARRG